MARPACHTCTACVDRAFHVTVHHGALLVSPAQLRPGAVHLARLLARLTGFGCPLPTLAFRVTGYVSVCLPTLPGTVFALQGALQERHWFSHRSPRPG